jgi:hypothetical protein
MAMLPSDEDLARDHERVKVQAADDLLNGLDEQGFGQRRHGRARCRIPEAPGIGVRDPSGWPSISRRLTPNVRLGTWLARFELSHCLATRILDQLVKKRPRVTPLQMIQ